MAEAQTHDALTQVLIANDGEVLARLRLSAAEAARVCNVTPRQLIYWTKKGLVKPSSNGDHDYDVFAMEKVIRIRQALEKGHSLEKAAQLVQREMGTLQAEAKRLDEMLPDALEDELRARLDAQGALENKQTNDDSAKTVALRLGQAIDELEMLLREVQPVGA